MSNDIGSFIEEFPLAPPGELDPTMIGKDLDQSLRCLLEIAGYRDSVIFCSVERDIDDQVYESTDVEFQSPLQFPIYVARKRQSSPYLVGKGHRWMGRSPFRGDSAHGLYETMRVYHETAKPEITVFLTPFDVLIYNGTGSLFHESGPRPGEYYSLHDSESDLELGRELIEDLQPPDHL